MIVVDIGEIVDLHSLNFFFIIKYMCNKNTHLIRLSRYDPAMSCQFVPFPVIILYVSFLMCYYQLNLLDKSCEKILA